MCLEISCVPGSDCFEWIKTIAPVIVTIIFGAVAGLLTLRQYQVAQAKLKLDLFERRYAIFQHTWEIVSEVAMGKVRKMSGFVTPFNNNRPQALFLFGKDIEEYIDTLSTNYTELETRVSESDGILGQARVDNTAKISELKSWFHEEAKHGVRDRFAPFLNFEKWK